MLERLKFHLPLLLEEIYTSKPMTIWGELAFYLGGDRKVRARLEKVLDILKSQQANLMLDLGTGCAYPTREIIRRGYVQRAVGIDYEDLPLRVASKKIREEDLKDKIELILCHGRLLPFRSDSFDLVHASGYADYLSRSDIEYALKESKRVTKPGGKLILTASAFGAFENNPLKEKIKSKIMYSLRTIMFKLTGVRQEFYKKGEFYELLRKKWI